MKSIEKKVGFAEVFLNILRRGSLLKESSIPTAKITAIKLALKEFHKSKDKRLVIYPDSQSSMQSIKYKENHSILKQIYDNIADLQNLDKEIIL